MDTQTLKTHTHTHMRVDKIQHNHNHTLYTSAPIIFTTIIITTTMELRFKQ